MLDSVEHAGARLRYVLFAMLGAVLLGHPAASDTLVVDGVQRSYDIVIPGGLQTPAPVLIVLHGGRGGAGQLRRYVDIDAIAAASGAITVYPDGLDGNWNDGRTGIDGLPLFQSNDVAFLDALIAGLRADARVDRTYIAGVSNGGMMAIRMACEGREPLNGIAVIAANLQIGLDCPAMRPMTLLHFMGTDDPLAPFDGGAITSRTDRGRILSADLTWQHFLDTNGCSGSNAIVLPDTSRADGTSVVQNIGQGCRADLLTTSYIITGGGHTWPGARPALRWLLGVTSQDISASAIITDAFFR